MTTVSEVHPCRLVIRCLAERKGNQWQAFTLEFGLAVQGDTLPEVMRKLESMVDSYLRDALTGEDRDHAYELLLKRNAPWRIYMRYYHVLARSLIAHAFYRSKGGDGMIGNYILD